MRKSGPKSCRRPVVSLSHATKSYRVNQLGSKELQREEMGRVKEGRGGGEGRK